ncbi:NAD-dependent epimerase/dehydratase family protein [Coraliomargarita parva]|uniref:NAD-dependent epimerase/dehydratase family protein n=1 Tax=Coraliomargarita parva TaxID=3014050 RepID=UPI0022B436FA|nr:NAD-dependent epimerase/dehydratase family protein [Coraliomargarita parva]
MDGMKVLVTGGGGFVGSYLIERLLGRGYAVRSLGRSPQPQLADMGVEVVCADLCDADGVLEACAGVDAVFHVAAKAGVWGSWESYYRPNVVGSRNIVEACLRQGVSRLVYTSTPSVVFNGEPIRGGDEGLPYGRNWLCHYAHSKAIAEEATLAANCDALKVCALRPHLIFGPGDPHLLPRVIGSAVSGRLKIVGEGTSCVDVSYVEDVADAHLAAFDALAEGRGAGRAYFISQGEPVELWPWLNGILEAMGHQPLTKKVSLPVAYAMASVAEAIWAVFRLKGEPPLTRFVAVELAKDHYFSIEGARRDLGYEPKVTMKEALEKTVKDLKERNL